MPATLPLTLNENKDLLDKFTNIKSVINKLEAQFNFQTLTANWYGDEEEILTIQLSLVTPTSFELFKKGLDSLSTRSVNISHFSDDVVSCFNKGEQHFYT